MIELKTIKRWIRPLGSLKLAVVLLVALLVILATATVYESKYDAQTARHLVYSSPLFALFLFLLGVNVAASTVLRYPFKKSLYPFVAVHAGILMLLAGSAVTMWWGVEGTLSLEEGRSGHLLVLDEPVLLSGPQGLKLAEQEAEFRWRPPSDEQTYRYSLGHGLTAVVDRYIHQAAEQVDYVPAEAPAPPALELHLFGSRAEMSQWITPEQGTLQLGPAKLRLVHLPDDQALQAFLQRPSGDLGVLQMLVEGQPVVVPVAEAVGPALALSPDLSLQVLETSVDRVVVEFADRQGNRERWLLTTNQGDRRLLAREGERQLPVRALFGAGQATPQRGLELAVGPNHDLYYRRDDGSSGPLKVKEPIATGWMDFQFEVERFVPHARVEHSFRATKVPRGMQGPGPAIRLSIEGSPHPGPYWLALGSSVRVLDAQGEPFVVGYGMKTAELGFEVALRDFEVGHDPGTMNPASYQSQVEVGGKTHTIAMNQPLEEGGYKLFQASYS
ncbi:MAG: cytochrome c biogenesis protein ResB, partial [Candidatus Eremiobacteraeota bacterium]|nr:cytochrome c biogenesis protein ResB [Candidatus Eremiobacteraeota bacterium]